MKRLLLMALFIIPLSFATWQNMSVIAMVTSLFALGMIYVVGYVINSHELKFLAREEMTQVLGTAFMLASFASFVTFYSSFPVEAASAIEESISNVNAINSNLGDAAIAIGKEGSKSIFCSFSAVGFGVSSCAGFRLLGSMVSQGLQLTSTALAELNAMKFIMDSANTWIINLFFPLGIFLRAFKYTRGAGSLLLAIGVALYAVLPITYWFVHTMVYEAISTASLAVTEPPQKIEVSECDEYALDSTNEDAVMNTFNNGMSELRNTAFYALIDATLTTIVSLAVMALSIKYLAKVTAAEVDVSALTRLI